MAYRQHVTNLALVAAMLGLGAYVYATRDAVTTSESKEREQHVLGTFRRDALTSIAFEGEGGAFTLVRTATGAPGAAGAAGGGPDAEDARAWRIEQGGQSEPADAFAVAQAAQNLEYASPERTIAPAEVDRARFGLAPARRTLTITMGALTTRLSLGGPAARPEGAIYVEVDGVVKVVKRSAFDRLDAPPEAFRSRQVAPYLSNDLRQIRLAFDGREVTLEKLVGLSWKLASGPLAGTRVDRFGLDRMLGAFADLKADHFLTEDAARQAQAGAAVQATVTMVPASGRPEGRFTVGGACPGHPDEAVVLRAPPQPLAACAAKGGLDALRRDEAALADARVFGLREDEFEEVTLEQGDRKLDLARKGNGWRQRAPVEADVAADQARALVKALGAARAEAPTRQGPAAFAPAARATVRGPRENEEARPAETVELAAPEADGRVWVRRQQDGAFLHLERDQARPFFPRTTALRSTQLVGESIERVRSIRLLESGALRQELTRSPDGVWKLTTPKGYDVDIGVAAEITESLLHLSAEQWVADRDDGSFGLERPRLRAVYTVDQGDGKTRTYQLDLGEVSGANTYGRLDGVEGVFVVPRALEQTLSSLALDLAVFQVNLDDVERVVLQKPDAPALTLAVRQGQLRPADGAPELPASKLDAIRSALADLRAQAAVHLGPARKDEGLDRPSLTVTFKRASGGDIRLVMGASDVLRQASVVYARREGVDATYAIAAARVRAVVSAF